MIISVLLFNNKDIVFIILLQATSSSFVNFAMQLAERLTVRFTLRFKIFIPSSFSIRINFFHAGAIVRFNTEFIKILNFLQFFQNLSSKLSSIGPGKSV